MLTFKRYLERGSWSDNEDYDECELCDGELPYEASDKDISATLRDQGAHRFRRGCRHCPNCFRDVGEERSKDPDWREDVHDWFDEYGVRVPDEYRLLHGDPPEASGRDEDDEEEQRLDDEETARRYGKPWKVDLEDPFKGPDHPEWEESKV